MTRLNSRGSITIDYLFAFFLVSGFCLIIMSFSATLSTVEIVQYMAFAAARNYFAGHVSESKQKEAALKKFSALKSNEIVAPLLNGGWFSVPEDSIVVDYNIPERHPEYKDYAHEEDLNLIHGVIVGLQANILNFQIPFFGGTQKTDRSGSADVSGFQTRITSFLGREPTFEECSDHFNEKRWEKIRALSSRYGAAPDGQDYVVINDNGC